MIPPIALAAMIATALFVSLHFAERAIQEQQERDQALSRRLNAAFDREFLQPLRVVRNGTLADWATLSLQDQRAVGRAIVMIVDPDILDDAQRDRLALFYLDHLDQAAVRGEPSRPILRQVLRDSARFGNAFRYHAGLPDRPIGENSDRQPGDSDEKPSVEE